MTRRFSLPISLGARSRPPTVDEVRKRLGGRASTDTGAGELVYLSTERGIERVGVVLFARGDELDVCVESGVVRRIKRASTRPADTTVSEELLSMACDARAFAALRENQRVLYSHASGTGEGVLVEKCRFGALIERSDGAVIGASFRRVFAENLEETN